MKKILIPVVIIILLVLIMPYVTGRVAQTVTTQLTEQVNERELEYGSLRFMDYQRGYRSSDFLVEWTAPTQLQPLFPDPVIYDCDGSHGVLSYTYVCRALNVPNYTEFVNEELDGVDPITIGGEVTVFGAFTKKVTLDGFTSQDENNSTITVAPGKLEISTNKDLEMFNLYGEFGGLTMLAEKDEMTLLPAQMSGTLEFNEFQLMLGTVDLSLDGMSMTTAQVDKMELDAITIKTYSEADGNKLNAGYSVTVGSVTQSAAQTTKPQELEDIEFTSRASGMDMKELSEISQRMKQLARFDAQSSLSSEEESNRNAEALAMLPELEDLLIAGLGMQLGFSAKLDQQPMSAELDAELIKDLSLGDFILLSVEPAAFIRKLKINVSANLPIDLIETNQASAMAVASSNLFERSEDAYEAVLKIDGENIELNGKRLTVEEFMARFPIGGRR